MIQSHTRLVGKRDIQPKPEVWICAEGLPLWADVPSVPAAEYRGAEGQSDVLSDPFRQREANRRKYRRPGTTVSEC